MKCVRSNAGHIRRVSDSEAAQLVHGYRIEKGKRIEVAKGEWNYCWKMLYKGYMMGKPSVTAEPTPSPAPEPAPKKAKKPRGKKAEKAAARKDEKAEKAEKAEKVS